MAPEVLLRQNHSFCADFYAVGVIAYELLVGKRPYMGRDRKTIREEMLGREAKVPQYMGHFSQQCHNFVNGVMFALHSCSVELQEKDWATMELWRSSGILGCNARLKYTNSS